MGSIAKLEDKPRNKCRKWRLFVSIGTVDGKRVQRSRRFDGTYTEAKAELSRFEVENGRARATAYSLMTFAEYVDAYNANRVGTVASSTSVKCERMARTCKHVIGDMRMVDITPKAVEDAYARLLRGDSPSGKALKPTYVYSLSTFLWSVFNDAAERGAIPSNPVDRAKRPGIRSAEEKEPPSAEEVSELISKLDMAEGHDVVILLCAAMGLRKGEALALRWRDVDGDVLHVRHSLRQPTELVPTKTGAGRRDLPIPSFVLDMLADREAIQGEQIADAVAVGLAKEVDKRDVPIASDELGRFITSEGMSNWWKKKCAKRYGMMCTLHDLRHAYLTTAALNGVPPRVMQALAGHSSPITTMKIYAHANMVAKEDAARAIASALHPRR